MVAAHSERHVIVVCGVRSHSVASRPTVWSQIVSRYGNQQSTFSKLRQPKLFTITHVLSAVSNLGQTGKLLNCKNWSIEIHCR